MFESSVLELSYQIFCLMLLSSICYLIYMFIFYQITFDRSIRHNGYLFNFVCRRRFADENEPERQLYFFYGTPS